MDPSSEWLADPTGRHDLRFWNGSAWTHHVNDGGADGTTGVDSLKRADRRLIAEEEERRALQLAGPVLNGMRDLLGDESGKRVRGGGWVRLASSMASFMDGDRLVGYMTTLAGTSAAKVFFDLDSYETLWYSENHLFYVSANNTLAWVSHRSHVRDIDDEGYYVRITCRSGSYSLRLGEDNISGNTRTVDHEGLKRATRAADSLRNWWQQPR